MREMTQEEAMRIIRNVADHNPHDVPSPAQVVVAVGQATWDVDGRMRLVGQMLEVYAVVGVIGEMIKKQVYHRHPVEEEDAQVALADAYEQMYLLDEMWMRIIVSAPKTLLGAGDGNL